MKGIDEWIEREPWQPTIKVNCSECGWLKEEDVEFLNIEEDIQGADVLTFKCPQCEQTRRSRRYG